MDELKCTSCGANICSSENFSKFSCPGCGEYVIVRCSKCKTTSNKYSCEKCAFEGP